MKLLYITNIPSPYRVDYFNELGNYCDLTVLFEKDKSTTRDKLWQNYRFRDFKGIILKGLSVKPNYALSFEVIKYLKNNDFDRIICTDYLSPTGMIAILYMRIHSIPYWVEGDGGFAKDGKGFREKVKKYFIKGADGYFSTSSQHDNYYQTYGAKKEKLYRVPYSSLLRVDILKHPPTRSEKSHIRQKLSINENNTIVSVGRFVYGKGFDVLLGAIPKVRQAVGVYIIGGEATNEYIDIINKLGLRNIHFVKFLPKDALNEYFKAADLFVLPTRYDAWGHVINEAMAKGLPVITTDKCTAGLELIKNDWNGYIVPVDEVDILADRINRVLENDSLREAMCINSLKAVKNFTIEDMAISRLDILSDPLAWGNVK